MPFDTAPTTYRVIAAYDADTVARRDFADLAAAGAHRRHLFSLTGADRPAVCFIEAVEG